MNKMDHFNFLLIWIPVIGGFNAIIYPHYGSYFEFVNMLYISAILPDAMLLCYCLFVYKDINIFWPYVLVCLFSIITGCALLSDYYIFLAFGFFIYFLLSLYIFFYKTNPNLILHDHHKFQFIFTFFAAQCFGMLITIIFSLASLVDMAIFVVLLMTILNVVNIVLGFSELEFILIDDIRSAYNLIAIFLLTNSNNLLILNLCKYSNLLLYLFATNLHWYGLIFFVYGNFIFN